MADVREDLGDGTRAEPPGDGRSSEGPPDDAHRAFTDAWSDTAYACFSSGHKFCRNVCPVMGVTRNENHSPTAFHANVVAMEQGLLEVADVADDYVHCTQCGACELRCPNTLMAGEFYRARTRTTDVVKADARLRGRAGCRAAELEALGRGDHRTRQRAGPRRAGRAGARPRLG